MPDELNYKSQGSTEIPKGGAKQLNEGMDVASQGGFQAVFTDVPADDLEEALFAPTEFPGRPLTYGARFGPGPDTPRLPNITPRNYLLTVAENIIANKDSLPDDALIWATRVITEG